MAVDKKIWVGLILLILCEYLLFKNYILREIIPFYPHADQCWFLLSGYEMYENIIAKGSFYDAIIHEYLMTQTFLFPVQAGIFYLFFGASRVSALTINFIYFALVQLFSFAYFKKISGSYFYSFLFILLLLSVNTLNMASDFRIDFIATCLYGMFCCAVLRADVFLSNKWAIISLVIAVFLILMRYITGCYIIGVGIVMLLYYCSIFVLKSKQNLIAETKARIKNLILFNSVVLLVFMYVFGLNYNRIHGYYILGHLDGPEKLLRGKEALLYTGLTPATKLFYYPNIFFTFHFPEILSLICIIMFVVFGVTYLVSKRHHNKKKSVYIYKNQLIFLLMSIIVPLCILSIDESKSPIAISIITIPFLYLLIFGFFIIAEKIAALSKNTVKYLLIVNIVIFSLFLPQHFLQLFSREQGHPWYDGRTHFDDKDTSVAKMVNDIGNYASFLHWSMLIASADKLDDYIITPIAPLYYETHHVIFNVLEQPLGGTILGITKQQAIDSLNHSNIFFTVLNNYSPDKVYPFENSVQPYRGLLKEMAEKLMIKLGDYYINPYSEGFSIDNYSINTNANMLKSVDYSMNINSNPEMLRVFVRPDLYIAGGVDNYITDQGIWLNVPGIVAQQIRIIKLNGKADFSWLKNRSLKVYAETEINKKDVSLKASLTISGNHYQIMCVLPEWYSDKALIIHLTFSDSYNDGHFQRVMPLPSEKIFLKD